MKKKKRHKLIIYGCAALGILLIGIIIAEGVQSLSMKKVDTSKGMKLIKKAETADAAKIENKIIKMEEKDRSESKSNEEQDTDRNYKALFANSVIMGDSISEAFTEFDILNASSVIAKIGVEINELDEQIDKAKKLNPQIIFLSYGMNDIIATRGDKKEFIKQYDALLKDLQKVLPDTKIFVNSIFPVQEKEIEKEPEFKKLADYNEVLRELCDKRQIAFIDNTDLVSDSYYEEDGVHFKASFYPYWLNHMAEVASL